MIAFRILVALLPQLLFALVVAAQLDLLSGWARSAAGHRTLDALYVAAPVATAMLLLVELFTYRRRVREARGTRSLRSLAWAGFALVLFVQAVAVDALIFSLARNH
jgi:hypothetical protein